MEEFYDHPDLGRITVRRSERARNLSISVRPGGEVRVTVPGRLSMKKALLFVEQRKEWIRKALEKIRDRSAVPQLLLPPYQTRHHTLELLPAAVELPGWELTKDKLLVEYPKECSPEDPTIQQVIREGLVEVLRKEARKILPERTRLLAAEHGFVYSKVSVRDAASRWGSCSATNSISLNIKLMLLPDHLVDYVILHELCHTVEKNHGPRFHELLRRVTRDRHEDFRKQMKKYTPRF